MARIRVLAENPPPPRGYVEDQLRELRDYITRLKDELEFLLTHLGTDNLDQSLTNKIINAADSVEQVDEAEKALEGRVDQVETALDGKQDVLTFDTAPTASSTNPVTSGGVFEALDDKQDTLTFDTTPTASSTNPVTSGGVFTALDGKQDTLTFDATPTADSTNPVTSGGIAAAVAAVMAPKAVVPNDLNDITANGFYTWAANQSKTNAPRTGPGFLLHLTQSGTRQVQTAWMSGNAMIYYRFKESGTWGAWQMLNVTA